MSNLHHTKVLEEFEILWTLQGKHFNQCRQCRHCRDTTNFSWLNYLLDKKTTSITFCQVLRKCHWSLKGDASSLKRSKVTTFGEYNRCTNASWVFRRAKGHGKVYRSKCIFSVISKTSLKNKGQRRLRHLKSSNYWQNPSWSYKNSVRERS